MSKLPTNHIFCDGVWRSTDMAARGNEESRLSAPIGSILIQDYDDGQISLFYKISDQKITSDDWYSVGDSFWSIDTLPISPALRAAFTLIRGNK